MYLIGTMPWSWTWRMQTSFKCRSGLDFENWCHSSMLPRPSSHSTMKLSHCCKIADHSLGRFQAFRFSQGASCLSLCLCKCCSRIFLFAVVAVVYMCYEFGSMSDSLSSCLHATGFFGGSYPECRKDDSVRRKLRRAR